MQNNFYVISGTSGTGKTTLLESLQQEGYPCYREPIRALLTEQLQIDGPALPSKNPSLFVEEMLKMSIRDYEKAKEDESPVFFDRGIPDVVAYAARFGVEDVDVESVARSHRYNPVVFLLQPWEAIFVKDEMRGKSFEEYLQFHEQLKEAYLKLDYTVCEVPQVDIKERTQFVMSHIQSV